ncbi:homeobox domain-containing protein [Ditylenchus destructor]|nr:homeobox domain-containing protein [Ditylenchus destructor]
MQSPESHLSSVPTNSNNVSCESLHPTVAPLASNPAIPMPCNPYSWDISAMNHFMNGNCMNFPTLGTSSSASNIPIPPYRISPYGSSGRSDIKAPNPSYMTAAASMWQFSQLPLQSNSDSTTANAPQDPSPPVLSSATLETSTALAHHNKINENEQKFSTHRKLDLFSNFGHSTPSFLGSDPWPGSEEDLQNGHKKSAQRKRNLFSAIQIGELEDVYRQKNFISSTERNRLADRIGLNPNQVKIWFQNRRYKDKKTAKDKAFLLKNQQDQQLLAINAKDSSSFKFKSENDTEINGLPETSCEKDELKESLDVAMKLPGLSENAQSLQQIASSQFPGMTASGMASMIAPYHPPAPGLYPPFLYPTTPNMFPHQQLQPPANWTPGYNWAQYHQTYSAATFPGSKPVSY